MVILMNPIAKIRKQTRATIARFGKFLSTFAEKEKQAPTPAQPTVFIGVERVKQILLQAANDFGIPTPERYPKGSPAAAALPADMSACWNYAHRVLDQYPAEQAEGTSVELSDMVDWQVEALNALGWDAHRIEGQLSFSCGYRSVQ
jgi:hypothetical protein